MWTSIHCFPRELAQAGLEPALPWVPMSHCTTARPLRTQLSTSASSYLSSASWICGTTQLCPSCSAQAWHQPCLWAQSRHEVWDSDAELCTCRGRGRRCLPALPAPQPAAPFSPNQESLSGFPLTSVKALPEVVDLIFSSLSLSLKTSTRTAIGAYPQITASVLLACTTAWSLNTGGVVSSSRTIHTGVPPAL